MSKNYTIILGGSGLDVYVHRINKEQADKLKALGELNGDLHDEIMLILGKNMPDETDEAYLGPNCFPEDLSVMITDEDDEIIYEENGDFEFGEVHDEENDFINVVIHPDTLIISDRVKGNFYSCVLQTDEEFDISKLTPIITDVGGEGDFGELVTGMKYDGKILQLDGDDYWSKGLNYCLF